VNYNAAMAPGYHVFMAAVLRATGSWIAVRAANLAIGVLLIGLAGHVAWRLSGEWSAAATTLTLAVSSYVVSGSVWLTTDNLGLLLAMGSLGLLILGTSTPATSLASGVFGGLAALVRQIHVWTAAPIAVNAFWSGLNARTDWTAGRVGSVASAALPVLAVGSLVLLWGGLLPPRFVGHHGGWNATAFVFGLALIGVYGSPWLLLTRSDIRGAVLSGAGVTVAGIAALAVIAPSSYDVQGGRWGGWLWEVVRRTPTVFDRSVVLIPLAIVGAGTLATLWRRAETRMRTRESGLIVIALFSWMAAQSANFQIWQRYFEPAILILLSWLIALAPPSLDNGRWLLPLAMAGAVLAATILLVHGDVYGFIGVR
jgi:hypothetical protein